MLKSMSKLTLAIYAFTMVISFGISAAVVHAVIVHYGYTLVVSSLLGFTLSMVIFFASWMADLKYNSAARRRMASDLHWGNGK